MAEAVTSVLVKLADILLENVREVQAVRGQIEQVQKELRLIEALRKDIDSKFPRNNVVAEWLNQVEEIANRIATVIDTFRDKIQENRAESSNWLVSKFKTAKRNYKKYKLGLHDELEKIIEELNRLYQRRTDLRIEDLGVIDDVDDPEPCDDVDDPEVVGLEDDQGKIIEQLLYRSISRRMVLSVVGTGGLGKTTLAQKVYNSNKLEAQFDCRAWQSISQTYNLNDLLREILYSVRPHLKKKKPPVTDRDLPVKLKNYFLSGKRYLIILDDVWDINLWGLLKKALPDMCNASRVIITTRLLDVAKAADCNTKPYKLRYLSDNEGLALLFRNAFQQPVHPENYPHLLDVAKRLTKKCGGLPLALVVLGGILTRRERTYTDWNLLYETMDWSNEDGIQCSQVLAKSYEQLPRYLKDCFLYFAAFPEDYKISGMHVTRMWIAEGFVPKDGGGTIEDRAEKCLQELVQRCLIQVTKKSWNDYCKYCGIHDVLRDLAIRKAKDENFFTIFSKEEDVDNLAASKPCRVALQFCTPTEDNIFVENTRSLLCFGFGPFSSNNSGFGLLNYSGFGLLQVLTLERVDMTTFTRRQWPKGLIHLRYLGLRDCNIPHDIFKQFSFSNLETMDFNGSYIDSDEKTLDLCDVVIPTLRHVYGNDNYNHIHLPLKWNKHTNLQTIMDVDIHIESVVELGFCINLRKFGICIVDNLDNGRAVKEWQNLKSVLKNTVQLVYLSIETGGVPTIWRHKRITLS